MTIMMKKIYIFFFLCRNGKYWIVKKKKNLSWLLAESASSIGDFSNKHFSCKKKLSIFCCFRSKETSLDWSYNIREQAHVCRSSSRSTQFFFFLFYLIHPSPFFFFFLRALSASSTVPILLAYLVSESPQLLLSSSLEKFSSAIPSLKTVIC